MKIVYHSTLAVLLLFNTAFAERENFTSIESFSQGGFLSDIESLNYQTVQDSLTYSSTLFYSGAEAEEYVYLENFLPMSEISLPSTGSSLGLNSAALAILGGTACIFSLRRKWYS